MKKVMNWMKKNVFFIMLSAMCLGVFYYFNFLRDGDTSIYAYFFLYLGIYIFSMMLPDNKIFRPIVFLISIPALILMLVGPLVQVLIFIMFSFLLPFMVITLIYKYIPEYVFGIDLSYSVKLYLVLVTGTIFSTMFSEKLMMRANKRMNYDKPEKRKKSQIELALKLVNRDRVRFIIYSSFFVYLVIYSISKLGDYDLFQRTLIDNAIFYSFISYIAFDRIIINLDLMKFSPKQFLEKLIRTWKEHDYIKD